MTPTNEQMARKAAIDAGFVPAGGGLNVDGTPYESFVRWAPPGEPRPDTLFLYADGEFYAEMRGRHEALPALLAKTYPPPPKPAEAVAILDRWLKAMDNPETEPPLEVHHTDLAVLRAAIACPPPQQGEMVQVSRKRLDSLKAAAKIGLAKMDEAANNKEVGGLIRSQAVEIAAEWRAAIGEEAPNNV